MNNSSGKESFGKTRSFDFPALYNLLQDFYSAEYICGSDLNCHIIGKNRFYLVKRSGQDAMCLIGLSAQPSGNIRLKYDIKKRNKKNDVTESLSLMDTDRQKYGNGLFYSLRKTPDDKCMISLNFIFSHLLRTHQNRTGLILRREINLPKSIVYNDDMPIILYQAIFHTPIEC